MSRMRDRAETWARKLMPAATEETRALVVRGYLAGHRATMKETREDRFLARLYEEEILHGHDPGSRHEPR